MNRVYLTSEAASEIKSLEPRVQRKVAALLDLLQGGETPRKSVLVRLPFHSDARFFEVPIGRLDLLYFSMSSDEDGPVVRVLGVARVKVGPLRALRHLEKMVRRLSAAEENSAGRSDAVPPNDDDQ